MSSISSVTASLPPGQGPVDHDRTSVQASLLKVAKDFETVMVHQLLEAAKLGGDGKDNGYRGMTVDAAANGIAAAGGLGLAKQIEDALSRGR